ncbi:MAG: glycerophosphodiester phosphodiesterase [Gemmatimonadetes bacterium]|nr:glycerophosphodiester phosphodiesterase [Gemmatimonadota bacterium]
MRRLLFHLCVLAFAAGLATPAVASAGLLAVDNPWLERRVLNIAHQGGEVEAPSNTLYALKTAKEKGSDVLEIDVHAAAGGELVVIHDATVNRTTNGAGRVDTLTVEQIKQLDAANWFVPGCGTCRSRPAGEYELRGLATGDRAIPEDLARFEPNDFRIPTLREVLKEFPRELINIEIKATAPDTAAYEETLAKLLREFGRSRDTIVVSFLDHAVERFKLFAPQVHTATATVQTALFWASAQGPLPGAPNPRYQALQVPIQLNGIPVVTREFVERAHANGLAVHVWTINDRTEMEWLVGIGVDGIMTDRPTLLEDVLGQLKVRYKAPPPGRAFGRKRRG